MNKCLRCKKKFIKYLGVYSEGSIQVEVSVRKEQTNIKEVIK